MLAEHRVVVPTLVGGTSALLSATAVWLTWRGGDVGAVSAVLDGNRASSWLAGIVYGVLGAVVLVFRRHTVLGAVLAVTGLCGALGAASAAYADVATVEPDRWPAGDLAAWAGSVLWLPAGLLTWCVLPLVFPEGRLVSSRWRWPARLAVVGGVVGICSLATTPSVVHDGWPTADNPFDLPIPEAIRLAVGLAGLLVAAAVGVAATGAIALRMRRSPSPRRQQEAWYVASRTTVVVAGLASLPLPVDLVAESLAAVALGIGILRHRLLDIETLLPRAVIFAAMTAVAVGVYLTTATVLGTRLTGGLGPVVVAAVATLILATGRQRAQRSVERLLFGARTDPLGAFTALSDRLAGALTAEQALPDVVRTVRESMRVPYAALRWADPRLEPVESGTPTARTAEFELDFASEHLGELVVGFRPGEHVLGHRDREVLAAFAHQISVAAHGARTEARLRQSREHLVVAREDERRRIRRDLHDGLGPALAGISLGLETAARAVRRGDPGARPMLEELRAESVACVDEVRRIVAGLRPTVLDEVSLDEALRLQAARLSRDAMDVAVTCRVSGEGRLPAAVEVATYRIALEAMTNAVRHSGGRSCAVEVDIGPEVRVQVRDDGCGRRSGPDGQGLGSMTERAEELGGWCLVTFASDAGTTVEAVLPVATP